MRLSKRFITNLILALAVTSVAIAGFVVNDIFSVRFNIDYTDTTTNINVNFTIELQFRREDFILRIYINSSDLARIMKISNKTKIAEQKFPYNKLNDVDFLTDVVIHLTDPIVKAIIDAAQERTGAIIINPVTKNKIINLFREQIREQIANNKKALDQVAEGAKIFKTIISAMMPFFIVNGFYMVSPYRIFIISFILFVLVVAMVIIFTAFVLIIPEKIKEASKGRMEIISGTTMKTYLANSYLAFIMFWVNWFISGETKKAYRKITKRFSSLRKK